MKKSIFTFLTSLFFFTAFSQSTGSIQGYIVGDDKQGLEGITIVLSNTKYTTITTEDGAFMFGAIPAGTYTLIAAGMRLNAEKQSIQVNSGAVTKMNLQLTASSSQLQEVTVNAIIKRLYTKVNSELATRSNTPLRDVPQAIQVIPRQILNDQQAYRLSDVYKNVAGVTEQSDYNYVNIRGFLTSSANFMLNGQRSSYFGLGVSPQIPYAERVEVLKGPSSVLYGNGAIGGTINIVTKKPKKEYFTDASITLGSFDLVRVQADVTGPLNGSKTLSALLNIAAESGGSFYQDFKNKSITVTPVFVLNIGSKTELTSTTILQVSHQTSSPTGVPVIGTNNLFDVPVNFRYAASDAKYNSNSLQEQLNLRHHFSDRLTANLWASYANRTTDAIIYQPGGYSPRVDSITRLKGIYKGNLKGYAVNAYLNYTAATGKTTHTIVAGFDYNNATERYPIGEKYWSDVIRLNKPASQPFNTSGITADYYDADVEAFGPIRSMGAYLQDQISFSAKLKALLALRYDDYLNRSYFNFGGSSSYDSSKANAWVPKIGLVYQPVKTLSIYGSYSQGFQPQYSNSRASGGPFPPLRAKQWEAGVKGEFFQRRLQPTLTFYQIKEANVLKPDPSDPTGIKQITTGEVTSRGLELTLAGAITANWNVLVNYAKNKIFISKSTDASEIGGGFGDTPKDAVSVWTTYQLRPFINGLRLGFGYRYAGGRSVYGLMLPHYTVIDGLIAYQYKKVGLAVNGFNLANKLYASGSFGTSYYFPGAPRTIQVSLNYNWQ